MGKYFYKVIGTMCLDHCPIFDKTFIGSYKCRKCKRNKGINNIQDFVICEHLPDNENPLLQEIIDMINQSENNTKLLAEQILEWHYNNK